MTPQTTLPAKLTIEETVLVLFFHHHASIKKIAYVFDMAPGEIESALRTHYVDIYHTLGWLRRDELSAVF